MPGTMIRTRYKVKPIQFLPPKFVKSGTEQRRKPALQSGKCPNKENVGVAQMGKPFQRKSP